MGQGVCDEKTASYHLFGKRFQNGFKRTRKDDPLMLEKMKNAISSLVLGIALLVFHSCDKGAHPSPEPQSTSINKILPLGASRVEGARPEFESFRYELWKDLIENGWTFDFIGTRSDGATYPTFNGNNFDTDHEGRGGFTSGEILQGLNGWLSQT